MNKAHWARAVLLAAALPACATAQGAPTTDTTASRLGTHAEQAQASRAAGRAAQPGSWNPGTASESQSFARVGPSGQAAQPGSWITPYAPSVPVATPLAEDGPSYLGGRAAQPYSWVPAPKHQAEPRQVAGL